MIKTFLIEKREQNVLNVLSIPGTHILNFALRKGLDGAEADQKARITLLLDGELNFLKSWTFSPRNFHQTEFRWM